MDSLDKRSSETELMDDLECSGEVVDQTLRELEFINVWLGGNAVTTQAFRKLLSRTDKRELSVCDLGCGGGDMLRHIHNIGKKRGRTLSLTGIDANSGIINYAKRNLWDVPNVQFKIQNVLSDACSFEDYDIVIGTLFFHHFAHEELISLFERIYKQVSVGLIVNDIHRHPLAFHSIRILTQWFSRSPMVKNDAPLSVRRAFRKDELEAIFRSAGIREYDIRWRWAFRWQAVASKR